MWLYDNGHVAVIWLCHVGAYGGASAAWDDNMIEEAVMVEYMRLDGDFL